MIERLRRAWTRHNARTAAPREPAADWRATLRRRVFAAAVLFGLWTGGIEARLVYLQVFRHADLLARQERQQLHTIPAPAERGDILDRNGRVLATSVDADSIYAVPSEIDDAAAVAAKLCAAFRDCTRKERESLVERLSRQRAFAYVRRQVSPDEAHRVADLDLDGVGFIKESRRFYPNRQLAAHLLGYVGIDGTGLAGIEAAYNSQISGKPGTILIQTDARRHAFSRAERPPTSGSTVELTIDEYLQYITERELHRGIVENHAAGGSAVVMDPHTGEILALANEPTFNPNVYRDFDDAARRDRAVQDLYEPGSTFKLVTASAAIENRVLPLDAMIDTSPGLVKIGSRVVHDTKNHGLLSFFDVIADSSNVGAIKIGFRVGAQRLGAYVERYGFGHPVSPDFPGESPGIVWRPDTWTDSALMSVSMGYQVGVTPLQMVAAVASIANGGRYMQPRAIRAIYRNGRRYGIQPRALRQTISADTAATLASIMEGVVERGTGTAAKMAGYTVAGKTGTAAKLVNGHYSHSDYNASFVGFVPSRNPAVAIIVVTDSPHGPHGYYGGSVSAPVFQRIAEAAMQYLGIPPTLDGAPPLLVARRQESPESPAAGAAPIVNLVSDGPPGVVPDLAGLSAREAVRRLAALGLTALVSGDGAVVSQQPAPGTPVQAADICRLTLDRTAPGRA
ncbi:MAG: penicillin-binding protein, partial [Betaproteobacteria bacterium]